MSPIFRKLVGWLRDRREESPAERAGRASPKKARQAFGKKLNAAPPDDDERTVRDSSDEQTVMEGAERGPRDEDGAPAGFRFNPALMAAMPVGADAPSAAERLAQVADEIASHLEPRGAASPLPTDYRSDVLANCFFRLSGSRAALCAEVSGGTGGV